MNDEARTLHVVVKLSTQYSYYIFIAVSCLLQANRRREATPSTAYGTERSYGLTSCLRETVPFTTVCLVDAAVIGVMGVCRATMLITEITVLLSLLGTSSILARVTLALVNDTVARYHGAVPCGDRGTLQPR